MTPITPPLNSGDRGGAVSNLQEALLLFLDKRLIQPSAEEETTLIELLRSEQQGLGYGRGTAKAVTLFQVNRLLQATGAVDAATAEAMNGFLKGFGAIRPNPDTVVFAVNGKVTSRDRAGVGGLRVAIVDKNVGEGRDILLAEAITNGDGSYRTTFIIGGLLQRDKERPDLQAHVFAGERLLGSSKVCYNATKRETLNVLLTEGAASALPSELETLTSDLTTHFKGNLRDLEESDDRQDITYLANKTGWDARAVALAALADQFSAGTVTAAGGPQIEAPLFYALFRAGLPANEDAVYQTSKKTAIDIWTQAIARGVIPGNLEAGIRQAAEQFQRLSVERSLNRPAPVGVSNLKGMLTVSLGDDEASHKRFAELYAQHRDDPSRLWESVRDAFGEAAEKRLRLDGQLGYLTLNNAPLIHKLHAERGQTGLSAIVALAEQGYYHADKWRDLIGEDAIPPEVPGETTADKRSRYADMLAAQVRLSFPTMVVAQMVKEGETPVATGMRDQVHAFLTEHQGKFELGMQPVERYIARNRLQVPQAVSKEVTRIQRVYQITPSDGAMNALLKSGIDSALAVTRFNQDQFTRRFKDEMNGEANARFVHANAQQVHNLVLNIAFSYLTAGIAPAIGEHSPGSYINKSKGSSSQASNAGDVIAYPTLEGLFGEMDFCACDHCRSILSPAAYLVDLLLFLDRADDAWATDLDRWKDDHGNAPYPFVDLAAWNDAGQPAGTEITPLEVLLERRPDIQHLPLTCENTNTALPYIDLVNETLEYFIANDTQSLSLTGYQGHSIDAGDQPEELLASPQFVQRRGIRDSRRSIFPAAVAVSPAAGKSAPLFRQIRNPVSPGHGGAAQER